jgi:hypothetical protein
MEPESATTTHTYPWYNSVRDATLEQVDFFFEFPTIVPVYPEEFRPDIEDIETDVNFYDVVVLSQSCDLQFDKVENVLVCPHFSLTTAKEAFKPFRGSSGRKEARQGKLPGYHVLDACQIEGFNHEVRIVNFYQVFTVPFEYAKSQVRENESRLRLLPPYREHLAQAFARFVMRVGLPQDIAEFD